MLTSDRVWLLSLIFSSYNWPHSFHNLFCCNGTLHCLHLPVCSVLYAYLSTSPSSFSTIGRPVAFSPTGFLVHPRPCVFLFLFLFIIFFSILNDIYTHTDLLIVVLLIYLIKCAEFEYGSSHKSRQIHKGRSKSYELEHDCHCQDLAIQIQRDRPRTWLGALNATATSQTNPLSKLTVAIE